jgi:predicted Fe-Mo cluster-binding NifX family protein
MRIAVAIQGEGLDALVGPRFGRASHFLVVEPRCRVAEVLDNRAGAAARGASGVDAGDLIIATGAEAAIAGHVGPKAFGALAAAHVAIYQVDNGVTAREAVAALERGDLPALEAPTIRGPWA